MSDFVEKVLESAGLAELLQTFKDQDIDEDVLRKLPDCQTGSIEERLFAAIVSSVGRRLKIINSIREVVAKVSEQHPTPRAEETQFNLVLIDSEENSSQISQSINSFEQESICSVNIYESDKCLLLEDALFNVKDIIIQSDNEKDPAAEEYEMKSWLSNSNSPKSQVLQYMKDTFNLRSLEIKNTTNLIDTLNEWPHLLETSGVIDVDFERLNPGKSELLLRKWPGVAKQICEFAEKSQAKAITEAGIKKLFSKLTSDEIAIAAFVMLPYLTSTSAYRKRGAKKVKITAAAAAEFFIQFVS
ncbi:hypothetical protein Fcan01_28578, partial [Folsomia candida]